MSKSARNLLIGICIGLALSTLFFFMVAEGTQMELDDCYLLNDILLRDFDTCLDVIDTCITKLEN